VNEDAHAKLGHPEDEATRRRLMDFEQLVEQETRRLVDLGRVEGLEQGLEQGMEKGMEKGLEKGMEKGRVEEARKAVERVLEKRQVGMTTEHRERLLSCTHLGTLERWLDQAITATSADEALR
jgi:flagellar biosynthesis/type III secretory pathway protein FliH